MKRRYVCANGGASCVVLVSLGVMLAAVLSAYANRENPPSPQKPTKVVVNQRAAAPTLARSAADAGGVAGGAVHLEDSFPVEVMAELAHMGHDVIPAFGAQRLGPFGKGQIIRRNPQTGVLEGGSDPRGDGAAAGY